MPGKVILVGAGPGHPDLITLRGARAIETADAIFYEPEIHPDLLARARSGAERIALDPPKGRRIGRRERLRLLIHRALAGQQAVYLKFGDPMLFHHGGEEALALRAAGVEIEIVPGIPFALAAALYAGIPVTQPSVEATVALVDIATAPEPPSAAPAPPQLPTEPPTHVDGVAEGEPPSPTSAARRVGRSVVVRMKRAAAARAQGEPASEPVVVRGEGEVEVVETAQDPGATRAIALPVERRAGAASGLPGEAAACGQPPNWQALGELGGSILLSLDAREVPAAIQRLLDGGRPRGELASLIIAPTLNAQRTLTAPLESLAARASEAGARGRCALIVGDVNYLRDNLNWFESRPLFGLRAVLADLPFRSRAALEAMKAAGVCVTSIPLMSFVELPDTRRLLAAALARLSDFHSIIFTSPLTVNMVFETLWAAAKDLRPLAALRIVAVYASTAAELERQGVRPDFLMEEFPTGSMIEALGLQPGQRVLLPRAAQARDLLPMELEQRGAIVETLPLYETLPDMQGLGRLRALLAADPPEIFLHGSASGFLRFWEALRFEERARLQQSVAHGCLNPAVARALISRGIEPAFALEDARPAALIEALLRFRASRRAPAAPSSTGGAIPPV